MIKFDTDDLPEGALLFNVRYNQKPECLEVVYFSPITEQLEVSYRKPIIDVYIIKPEFRSLCISRVDDGTGHKHDVEHQISQVEIDKCFKVSCKPSQIPKVIANEVGGEWAEKYEQNKDVMSTHDLKAMMCECPYIMKGDLEPDVYFRLEWIKNHGLDQDISHVTYGLVDIETDVLDRSINMRDIHSAPQPINAVTVILSKPKICAVLMLAPRAPHQIDSRFHELLAKQQEEYDWIYTHQEEFKRMIVEDDADNKVYLKDKGDYDIRLHFFDFNNEIGLIKTVFDYINKYRPWFVMSWNAKFDHNYLYERVKYLGYDPYDIIVPPQFQTPYLYYKEDTSAKYELSNASDWWFTSTYSVYVCQQRLFAQIRKSQKKPPSLALTVVGGSVAGIHKLTETKSGTFREFAYTDYIKFILYNVRDVVVQLAIEEVVNDCVTFMSRSYSFATRFDKCFKETHIVRGCREYYFEEFTHKVQACKMIDTSGRDTAYKGAYVAPPDKNAPTGELLNGKFINNIIHGALDADAKSYYPSTKSGCNMNAMTLLYKCIIDNDVFRNAICINRSFNQEYIWWDNHNPPRVHEEDMSGYIINAYKNHNIGAVLHNWMNLPTITEYFDMIDEMLHVMN